MRIDTFGVFVRVELDHWGREYALHRDREHLGHQSKNILQQVIKHKGDLPGRTQGYKPLESDSRAQMIEDIVASMASDSAPIACALRAYHCGMERRKVERYETYIKLMAECGQRAVSTQQYLSLVELGFQRVRGRMEGSALAA